MSTKRYIFVCSGNICRSPLAAAMAKQKLEAKGISAAIISAGTLNIVGRSAAEHSVTVANRYELDISTHRSQGLSVGLADLADALIVMSPKHSEAIRKMNVDTEVVELWRFDDSLEEIADPIGQNLAAFEACGALLDRLLDDWVATLE